MKILIGNVQSRAIIGGMDNLLPFDLYKVLRDFLKMQPKDYYRTPAYNRFNSDGTRQWDGWKYFINTKGYFATGYLPAVLRYMEDLKVPVDIEDQRHGLPVFAPEYDPYIGNINGEDWYIRDYQREVVFKANNYITFNGRQIYFPRGIIDAATNAGKNSIMASMSKNFKHSSTIMLIHNSSIYKQAVEFFSQCFSEVGQINSKYYKLAPFTIAMQKTLHSRMKKSVNVRNDMNRFSVLYIDEGHRVNEGDYIDTLIEIPAAARYIISGTPLDADNNVANSMRVGITGETLTKITNRQLIEAGVSLPPHIHILLNKSNSGFYTNYDTEYNNVIKFSKDRIELLKNFMCSDIGRDKCTLIAFNDIEHGEFIYEQLKNDHRFFHLNIALVHAQDKEREKKLESLKNGEIDIMVGSTIMQEGLNIPRIQMLVYCIGGESKIRLKQFIGRAIRDDGKSSYVLIVDFFDVGRWVGDHSVSRLNIYREEGFEDFQPILYHYDHDLKGRPVNLQMLAHAFALK